jgi:hypothetical protein
MRLQRKVEGKRRNAYISSLVLLAVMLLAIAIMKFILYLFLDFVDDFIHECHLEVFLNRGEKIEIRSA